MADAILSWQKSPSSNVNKYTATFTVNGTALNGIDVPANSGQDATGYVLDLSAASPSTTLNPGDVIGASVVAVDTVNSLTSTPDVANTVTVPTAPVAPQPPVGAALALA